MPNAEENVSVTVPLEANPVVPVVTCITPAVSVLPLCMAHVGVLVPTVNEQVGALPATMPLCIVSRPDVVSGSAVETTVPLSLIEEFVMSVLPLETAAFGMTFVASGVAGAKFTKIESAPFT